jgi:hypothetical protein
MGGNFRVAEALQQYAYSGQLCNPKLPESSILYKGKSQNAQRP